MATASHNLYSLPQPRKKKKKSNNTSFLCFSDLCIAQSMEPPMGTRHQSHLYENWRCCEELNQLNHLYPWYGIMQTGNLIRETETINKLTGHFLKEKCNDLKWKVTWMYSQWCIRYCSRKDQETCRWGNRTYSNRSTVQNKTKRPKKWRLSGLWAISGGITHVKSESHKERRKALGLKGIFGGGND